MLSEAMCIIEEEEDDTGGEVCRCLSKIDKNVGTTHLGSEARDIAAPHLLFFYTVRYEDQALPGPPLK